MFLFDVKKITESEKIIAWWSGGVTSAITCYLCLLYFGKERVRVVMIDTHNEDDDTYRFKRDCEAWWGVDIEVVSNKEYKSIEEVWYRYNSLNVANGAICSTDLKRKVRQDFVSPSLY